MNEDVLVLFSGGQDSSTCLAIALQECSGQVYTLALDYGQRHQIELDQAQKIADKVNVPFEVLDLKLLSQLTTNALTNPNITIEHKEGELPSTFVDGRNMLFLSFAGIYAKQKGIHTIYTGVCETDYSGYPDCRKTFIESMQNTLSLALDYSVTIKTPLMHLTKAQTVAKMQALGRLDLYALSHTCYEGKRPACGRCPACQLRRKGFRDAGVEDPLPYLI